MTDRLATCAAFRAASTRVCSETPGSLPAYLPGDIVETRYGGIGVIVKAQVVVDGSPISWNGSLPATLTIAQEPTYELESVPGYPAPSRAAWWRASDWASIVAPGPLHVLLLRRKVSP